MAERWSWRTSWTRSTTQALATYRRAVAALDRKLEGRDQWERFEVDAMLLELADHDGDVDRAVAPAQLSGNTRSTARSSTGCGRPAAPRRRWHGSIVQWPRDESPVTVVATQFWLSPDDVAATYQGLGRIDDAVAVLRADFVRQPSVGAYRVLLDFAAGVDRVDTERAWAFDHARQLATDRFAAGAVLVQLCLSEGDVEAAWQAADRYGPGWAWRELADRGAEARPVDAADLYRPQLEKDLRLPQLQALSRHRRDTGDDGRNSMNEAVAAPISRRSSRRSARTTAGDPR